MSAEGGAPSAAGSWRAKMQEEKKKAVEATACDAERRISLKCSTDSEQANADPQERCAAQFAAYRSCLDATSAAKRSLTSIFR